MNKPTAENLEDYVRSWGKDAAELIAKQEARIRELEASVPRWIPVSDKDNRPKDGQTVFAYCVSEEQLYVLDYAADENDGQGAFGVWKHRYHPERPGVLGSGFITVEEVSHWMKYPEPPEEVNHE